MVPSAFNIIDPINGPNLKTLSLHVFGVTLPIWCVIFGIWRWSIIRESVRGIRRTNSVQDEPAAVWDEWLDGPDWIRS